MSNTFCLIALFTASSGRNTLLYLVQSTNSRTFRLSFEQNAHQFGFVAHHIHLCFQATCGSTPQTVRHKMKKMKYVSMKTILVLRQFRHMSVHSRATCPYVPHASPDAEQGLTELRSMHAEVIQSFACAAEITPARGRAAQAASCLLASKQNNALEATVIGSSNGPK